eukprot:1795534-Rhodomonas_salina.2
MSCTDRAYGATMPYEVSGTDRAYGPTIPNAVSAYGAVRCAVLPQHMVLCAVLAYGASDAALGVRTDAACGITHPVLRRCTVRYDTARTDAAYGTIYPPCG